MHRRFLIFIATALILIAVLAGGLWYLLRKGERGVEDVPEAPQSAVEQEAARLRKIAQEARGQGQVAPTAPQIVARLFLERYGSYSNQSNFENLEDLYPSMTARMRASEEARVARMRAPGLAEADYEGVNTKVVGATLLQINDTEAQVRLQTQRNERSVRGERVFYQSARVTLAREGEAWKVDGVEWEAVL